MFLASVCPILHDPIFILKTWGHAKNIHDVEAVGKTKKQTNNVLHLRMKLKR